MIDIFESQIAGIPCQIEVTRVYKGYPQTRYQPEELPEIEFSVLDRKGYAADWLERKMTQDDIDRINREYFDEC